MKELVQWLKDNVGDSIQIITPQFERTSALEFNWKPANDEQFYAVIEKAPLNILLGLGFRRWETMNNLIKENFQKPIKEEIKIPMINSDKDFVVDIGRGQAPTQLLEVDEDVLLFPCEWYNLIPDGLRVTGLYGELDIFKKDESDDDIRCGCLPYGIRRRKETE